MATGELQILLHVLEERDIPLGNDDIAWAFETASTRDTIASWVQESLSPVSILTKEELSFHDGQRNVASKSQEVSTGRALDDADFETAISSLEASTAAIERQCQMIEAQKHALKQMTDQRGADKAIQDAGTAKQKKLSRDKAQLDLEMHDLTDSLQSKLQASSKQTDTAVATLPNNIDRILEKDDRLLDGLQKMLSRLEPEAQPDLGSEMEINQLCDALITLCAQEIRVRIDAVYSMNSQPIEALANGHEEDPKTETQRQSLRAELSELCGEIEGLATMAVDNQFRTPIMRELKTVKSDSDLDRARWSEYIVNTLHYLVTRLETLADHCQHLHAHQNALKHTATTIESVLTTPAAMKHETSVASKAPTTPIARGLKPLRLVQAHSEQDPTTQLLRYFDIRTDPTDAAKLSALLEQAVAERKTQLANLRMNTGQSVSDSLAETIAKADENVDSLLGAVYVHSKFASIHVVDQEIAVGLDELEAKTKMVGEAMRSLDINALEMTIRKQQQALLRQ